MVEEEIRSTCEWVKSGEADARLLYNKWLADPNLTNVRMEEKLPNQYRDKSEWWVWADIVNHLALLHQKYTIRPVDLNNGETLKWGSYTMEILMNGEKIGEYHRNYSPLKTFYPFLHHGKEYALYSAKYTATRVMSLPDCKDLCGEEDNSYGFCPVEYFVPYDPFNDCHGDFGFVAGCIWGDDTSWKIEYLDLSRIEEGVLERRAKFGYLELPEKMDLKDAVRYDPEEHNPNFIAITNTMWFDLKTGKPEYL